MNHLQGIGCPQVWDALMHHPAEHRLCISDQLLSSLTLIWTLVGANAPVLRSVGTTAIQRNCQCHHLALVFESVVTLNHCAVLQCQLACRAQHQQ